MQSDIAASLEAQQNATLAASHGGTVTQVLFRSGEAVRKGQVLVQLDNGPELAQLALDEAKLAQAERDDTRLRKLMAIAGASESALEQAIALAAEARAQVSLDEATLAQLQVTAPFDGVTGIRTINAGDYLQTGAAVVTLTATGKLRVLFSVPQTEAGGLAIGEPFQFTAPGTGSAPATAPGEIVAMSPDLDSATNARNVEGHVTGNDAMLLPGMRGAVEIATGAPIPAFALPDTALNDGILGPYIFILMPAGGAAYHLATVYVTLLGARAGHSYVTAPGLKAGQKAVAIGGFKLNDGASVSLATP